MEGRVDLTGVADRQLDRRQFLKAAGAATVLGAAGVLGGNLLLACAPKAPPKAGVPAGYEMLRMVGSSIGSKSTTVVMAYASILNRYYPEIEWSSVSGATTVNVIQLAKGAIKLALSNPTGYVDSYSFDKVQGSPLRSISMPTELTHYFFIIPADKPWKDIAEVPKGLTLCPGSPGTTVPVVCEAWINLAGLTKKDFNWVPLAQGTVPDAWREGKIDLTFQTLSGSAPWLTDIATAPRKIKALGLTPEQVARAKAEQTFERIGLEAPSKGAIMELSGRIFEYDIVCPMQPTSLNVRDDFPEEIAYKMARTFDEHIVELGQIYSAMKIGTPQWHIKWAKPPYGIHAGVARYYREKGYLK